MKSIGVAELKKKVSAYLRLVENGEEVLITSYRRPVARLTPDSGGGIPLRKPQRPLSALRGLRGVQLDPAVPAGQYLAEDRSRW